MEGVESDGKEEDACVEDQDVRNAWKDGGSRAGHIPSPKGHGRRRSSKGGGRQRLTIHCKEQRAHQGPGYLWGIK